jgi:hypothetical protein
MASFRLPSTQIKLARPPPEVTHGVLTLRFLYIFYGRTRADAPGKTTWNWRFSLVIVLPFHKLSHTWLTTYVDILGLKTQLWAED